MAVDDSNAGIATVLQYVAPVIIMLYTSLVNRKLPEVSERIALVLAFGGVILIATHGDLTQLTVSKTTLFLGLASALATVFYNLLPGNLMSEYGTFAIVGWGMLISGIGLIPINDEVTLPVPSFLIVSPVGTTFSVRPQSSHTTLLGSL